MSGATGNAGSTGNPGTAGTVTPAPDPTPYASTTQRGTSGTDLFDGHQAPQITHTNHYSTAANAGSTSYTVPAHMPANGQSSLYHHTASAHNTHGAYNYVGRSQYHYQKSGFDVHSHSNNVVPHGSRNHYGHTVSTATGHNHHYYNNGNKHANLNGINPHVGGHYHGNLDGHDHHSHATGNVHGNNGTYRSYQPHFYHAGSGTAAAHTHYHMPANGQSTLYHYHASAHNTHPAYNYSHTAYNSHPSYTHQGPNSTYNGGAGGTKSGTLATAGTAAPAVTGGAGKRGGAGGGGGIIVITESTPSGISYDTLPGQTADSDTYSASSGYTYVLLNA